MTLEKSNHIRVLTRNRIQNSNKLCHILGNGPSLKDSLSAAKVSAERHEGIIMAANTYYLSDSEIFPAPHYYVFGDPVLQTDDYIANLENIFLDVTARYPGVNILSSRLIANHISRKLNKYDRELIYRIFHTDFSDFLVKGQYSFALEQSLEPYQNVLIMMMQFAIFLGHKKLCLHGFDLSMSHNYQEKREDYFHRQSPYSWKTKPAKKTAHEITSSKNLIFEQFRILIRSAFKLGVKIEASKSKILSHILKEEQMRPLKNLIF